MTGARMPVEEPVVDDDGCVGHQLAWGFPRLDRIDAWPTLQALWLGPESCALLLVTRDLTGDLARLRRWTRPASWNHLEASLHRQAREMELSGRLAWYRRRNRDRPLPVRTLGLQNRLERGCLLPALEVETAAGMETQTAARGNVQAQTAAMESFLHPTLVRVEGDTLVFDTFVWDGAQPESPYGYDAWDHRPVKEHRLRLGNRSFKVIRPQEPTRPQEPEKPQAGSSGRVFDDYRPPVGEEPDPDADDPGLSDEGRRRLIHQVKRECYREEEFQEVSGLTCLNVSSFGQRPPRCYREFLVLFNPGRTEWLCRNACRAVLPELDHEDLHLHLSFPLRIGGGPLGALQEGVLSIRVPLHAAWHGVDLSDLLGPGSGLFLAVCDTGLLLRWRLPGRPAVVCRPDLEEVIELGAAAGAGTGPSPVLEALLRDPELTDPSEPWRGPVSCTPGSVTRLVVSGHPYGALRGRLGCFEESDEAKP